MWAVRLPAIALHTRPSRQSPATLIPPNVAHMVRRLAHKGEPSRPHGPSVSPLCPRRRTMWAMLRSISDLPPPRPSSAQRGRSGWAPCPQTLLGPRPPSNPKYLPNPPNVAVMVRHLCRTMWAHMARRLAHKGQPSGPHGPSGSPLCPRRRTMWAMLRAISDLPSPAQLCPTWP